jgi:hypothetical protein
LRLLSCRTSHALLRRKHRSKAAVKKRSKRKTPPFRRGLSLRTHFSTNVIRSFAFTLLSRFLALPARILLLLAGLLAAALLLARFLSGGLILLAGILVRISHRDLPWFSVAEE